MLNRIRKLFFRAFEPTTEALTAESRLLAGEFRGSHYEKPIELCLAGRRLRLYPEYPLCSSPRPSGCWILVDEERYFREISGFIRIASGERVIFGRDNEACQKIFDLSRPAKRRQLEIENENGLITLRRLDREGETLVRYVDDPQEAGRPQNERLDKLVRLRRLFGGPLALSPPELAISRVQRVNEILRNEPHRPTDSDDRPGGVIDLPDSLSPIVVGDLHAQLDNLLKILSEDGFLSALCDARACLVFLGDTIHPEGDRDLEQMDSSLLMLDLILRLKAEFPANVFYIRGNHESFSAHVSKAGVPQGALFRRRARELRGPAYEAALTEFFELLPLVVRSRSFVACHGGPPRRSVDLQDLIDVRRHPHLAQELIWNRVRRPHHIAGYGERNVEAFKRTLGVGSDTPLIVGHTPLSRGETLWMKAGGIPNHHILYGAHSSKVAVFAEINGRMVPLEYPAEPLLDFANSLQIDEEPVTAQADRTAV